MSPILNLFISYFYCSLYINKKKKILNLNCGLVLRVVGFVCVVGLFVEIVVICNWLLVLGFVDL